MERPRLQLLLEEVLEALHNLAPPSVHRQPLETFCFDSRTNPCRCTACRVRVVLEELGAS